MITLLQEMSLFRAMRWGQLRAALESFIRTFACNQGIGAVWFILYGAHMHFRFHWVSIYILFQHFHVSNDDDDTFRNIIFFCLFLNWSNDQEFNLCKNRQCMWSRSTSVSSRPVSQAVWGSACRHVVPVSMHSLCMTQWFLPCLSTTRPIPQNVWGPTPAKDNVLATFKVYSLVVNK